MRTKNILHFIILIGLSNIVLSQSKPNINAIDDAVVLILRYNYDGEYSGHGSGFIIDNNGTIITNYHVIEGAYSLKVRINRHGIKKEFQVNNIIGISESRDLAKITIKNPNNENFTYLKKSIATPLKADECWTIGTPADPEYMNTVTEGIISNIYPLGISQWKGKMLQVSAPYTHGSSGGALVNNKGEVVGVTCGGAADSDGARANINWAIWIGEVDNLETVNLKRIVDPNTIPGKLCFYTNDPNGYVDIYIDGYYVGALSKFFNDGSPYCGQEGTVTTHLYPGKHNYKAINRTSNSVYSNIVFIEPEKCKRIKLLAPSTTTKSTPTTSTVYKAQKRDYSDKGSQRWVLSSGLSFVYTRIGMPYPIFLERYSKSHKYSVRGCFQTQYRKGYDVYKGKDDVNINTFFYSFGIDLKKNFIRKKPWTWYLASSYYYKTLRIRNGVLYDYMFKEPEVDLSYFEFYRSHYFALRLGSENYKKNRIYFGWDTSFGWEVESGPNSKWEGFNMDLNIILGIRF